MLLPAYAKFGVNTPAAALFSTLGASPATLARHLGEYYLRSHPSEIDRYDYPRMLQWMLTLDPYDLVAEGGVSNYNIRRLMRLLASLNSLNHIVRKTDRGWIVEFHIAGWQYNEGDIAMPSLKVGQYVILRPEPGNVYDSQAIEIVSSEGLKLGYVPRTLSSEITKRLNKKEVNAVISQISPSALAHEKVQIRCSQ